MKRIAAFIIDYFIFLIIYTIVLFVFVFFNKDFWLGNSRYIFTAGRYLIAMGCILLYVYFLLLDLFDQFDVGKRVTKIRILMRNDQRKRILVFHSLLKLLCSMIWPISLVFYAATGKMPYDRWLGITVKEED